MSKIYKLDNHRPLKDNELIQDGDLYREVSTGRIRPVTHSIGYKPSVYSSPRRFEFFRRRHTKKPVLTTKSSTVTVTLGKPTIAPVQAKTPRFPEIKFLYPSTKRWGAPMERHVKVISKDETYIIGLEVLTDGGHQFKKFCVDKVIGEVKLVRF